MPVSEKDTKYHELYFNEKKVKRQDQLWKDAVKKPWNDPHTKVKLRANLQKTSLTFSGLINPGIKNKVLKKFLHILFMFEDDNKKWSLPYEHRVDIRIAP